MTNPFESPAPSFTLDSHSPGQGPGAVPGPNDAAILDDYSRVVTSVVDRVGPSVVRIDVRKQGRSAGSFERSIDVLVSGLRHKIEPDPKDPEIIKTVRSGGYLFTPRVERRS